LGLFKLFKPLLQKIPTFEGVVDRVKGFQTVTCEKCGHVAYTKLINGWFTCIWCDEMKQKGPKQERESDNDN
jgi:hypothetical protein